MSHIELRASKRHQPIEVFPFKSSPLLVMSIRVTIILASLCFALIAYSSTQPTADFPESLGLALCADLPCFRGLTPGLTSWSEAIREFGGRSMIVDDANYAQIVLYPSPDNTILETVFLDIPFDTHATVATIIALYGNPNCIDIYHYTGNFVLRYPMLHLTSRFDNARLHPSAQVLNLVIGNPYSRVPQEGCNPENFGLRSVQTSKHRWMGFASMTRYINDH